MSVRLRELYGSPNGDRWYLARDTNSDRVFVRHQPNAASGGRVSDVELDVFLSAGRVGPEHQELLRLVRMLVA